MNELEEKVLDELEAWHPEPGTRYFRPGDEVRIDGERGGAYAVRGFRREAGRVVVELFGARKRGRAPGFRVVPAERLRRLPAGALRP